jgi:hypothetical protein
MHTVTTAWFCCVSYHLNGKQQNSVQKMSSSADGARPTFPALDPHTEPMTRHQVEEVRASLKRGMRVKVTWKYGESQTTLASPTMVWRGVVENENEDDDDARRVLIRYDAGQESLEEGGAIPFPPPLLNDRQAEIFAVEIEKLPGRLPDLGMLFDRSQRQWDRPDGTAEAAVGSKRTREGEPTPAAPAKPPSEVAPPTNDALGSLEGAEQIAAALKGDTLMTTLAPNLRIPRYINTWISVLYPNLWLGRQVNEWKNTLQETCFERDLLPVDERERRIFFAKRDSFVSWLATTTMRPTTKDEWRLAFGLAADMAAEFAFAQGGFTSKNKFSALFLDAYENGKLDFEKILDTAIQQGKKNPPRSPNPKNGKGGATNSSQQGTPNGQQGTPTAAAGTPTHAGTPFRGRGRRRF